MSTQRNIRTYKKVIPANGEIEIQVAGNMFNVLKSAARFTIEFDESNKLDDVPEGASAKFGNDYEKVKLKSTIEQSVTIVLGFGNFTTATTQSVDTVNASLESPNSSDISSVALSGSTVVQLSGADTTRREIIISVPSDSDTGVLISQASAGISDGFLVEIGQVIGLATQSAIFAKSENGDDVRLNVIISRVV
jgi:hypothetical protein